MSGWEQVREDIADLWAGRKTKRQRDQDDEVSSINAYLRGEITMDEFIRRSEARAVRR